MAAQVVVRERLLAVEQQLVHVPEAALERLVRARMQKSYAAARASLLCAEEPKGTDAPALATSDEAIRRRTGRGWEQWFELLDQWGAADRTHREIALFLAAEQGVEPLA